MQKIEQFLDSKDIRVTAMRLLIYKFLAEKQVCEQGCNCEIETDLHLHFHCNNCNETVCLTEHKIPQIKVPDGFVSENVNLVVIIRLSHYIFFIGLCNKVYITLEKDRNKSIYV